METPCPICGGTLKVRIEIDLPITRHSPPEPAEIAWDAECTCFEKMAEFYFQSKANILVLEPAQEYYYRKVKDAVL